MATYTKNELKNRGTKVGGMLYVETTDNVAALAEQVYDTDLGKDQLTINKETKDEIDEVRKGSLTVPVATTTKVGGVRLATSLTDVQERSFANEGIAFVRLTTEAGLSAKSVADNSTDVKLATGSEEGVNVAYIDLPGLDNAKGISLTTAGKVGLKIDTDFFTFGKETSLESTSGTESGNKTGYYPDYHLGELQLNTDLAGNGLMFEDDETTKKKKLNVILGTGLAFRGTGNAVKEQKSIDVQVAATGSTQALTVGTDNKLAVNIEEAVATNALRANDSGVMHVYVSTAAFRIDDNGYLTLSTDLASRITALEDTVKKAVYWGTPDTSELVNK